MRYRPDLTCPDSGQKLDLWLPDASPRAVLLYLHGGGFVKGSRDDPAAWRLADQLCGDGVVVASADYRLGAQMEDLPPADRLPMWRLMEASARAGLTVSQRLYGPAFGAALFDASAAVLALRFGTVLPQTRGLPLFVVGMSAGGILGLSLAHPPAQWQKRLARPDGVVAIAAAMVQPWAMRPMAPPCVMLHGRDDRVIDIANPRLAATIARRRGAPLRVVESGVRGHNAQIPTFLEGAAPDGRPWLSLLTDMMASTNANTAGSTPQRGAETEFAP